jgi:hypothetical protein
MVARNLLIPFRRDRKRDLATGVEEALLASKVRQVLLTEGSTVRSSGELPWRTNFGAGLGLARHRPNDAVLAELTRVQVRDALRRWLPSLEVLTIDVAASAATLAVRVRVREGAAEASVTTEL